MSFVVLILLVLAVLFGVVAFDRWRWKRDTGKVPRFGSVSNAVLEVQSLFESQKRHVLEMRREQEQKRDEQNSGDPPSPGSAGPRA